MSAFAAFHGNRPAEAKRLCEQILATDPRLVDVRVLHAVLVGQEGRPFESVRMLRSIVDLAPNSRLALHYLGVQLRLVLKPDEAIGVARRLMTAHPKVPDGYVDLGLALIDHGEYDKAIEHLERATLMFPKEAFLFYSIGVANAKLFRFGAAEIALKKAVSLFPHDPNFYIALADVSDNLRREQAAIEYYRKAAELEPGTQRGASSMAIALMYEGDHEGAERVLREALRKNPKSADLLSTLSTTLQQIGRFDDAYEQARLALEADSNQVRPYTVLLTSAKVTENEMPYVEKLAAFVDGKRLGPNDLLQAEYALGKAYDDLRDYDEAMRHYVVANDLMKLRQDRYNIEGITEICRVSETRFTKALFAKTRSWGAETDLPIFIVGMIRSGTTLTEQILSSHPDVGAAGETQYWAIQGRSAFGLAPTSEAKLKELQDGFIKLLRSISPDSPRVTEKMPLNYEMLGLIHMAFPNAKIVHCRRKPIDTCLSIYVTHFKGGCSFGHDQRRIVDYYRVYLRFMEHWRKVIPPDRLLEVDYETLVSDPEPTVRKMVEFCGLPWNDACLSPEANQRTVVTPSLWQVRQPVYKTSVERWRRYGPWLKEFRELLTPEERASLESGAA